MCGIIGYVGHRQAQDVLLDGLSRLEYRGYDSAGLAVHTGGAVLTRRAVGNLAMLRRSLDEGWGTAEVDAIPSASPTPAGRRTAGVTEANAHPHSDCEGRIHVVLNGIVENHRRLRDELELAGCSFTSQTDAEPIAHLVERHLRDVEDDLYEAVRRTALELDGHYAIVVLDRERPGHAGRGPQGVPTRDRARRRRDLRRVGRARVPRRSPTARWSSATTRSPS